MKILLDTNVLLRLGDSGRDLHVSSVEAVTWLSSNGYEIVLVPQLIYEYWVVATRPTENNGLGMHPAQVDQVITQWLTLFPILLDERGVFKCWRDVVTKYDVKGKVAHDARLVAAMERHAISHLLTCNRPDFLRFASITAITPGNVLDGLLAPRSVGSQP